MTPDRPGPEGGRERDLERRAERIAAELAGVRSGVLLEIERRENAPDLARTPNLLAGALGMSVQAVNNHCARMVRAGVLEREALAVEGGGRRFTYRVRRRPFCPACDLNVNACTCELEAT